MSEEISRVKLFEVHRHLLKAEPMESQAPIDGLRSLPGEQDSYEDTFRELLSQDNAETFEQLMLLRKAEGKSTQVLDLFGGGYFIQDLTVLDGIVAARLENIDQSLTAYFREAAEGTRTPNFKTRYEDMVQFLSRLQNWPGRKVVTGNLYSTPTWEEISAVKNQKGIDGFDLVTCRPYGAFGAAAILQDKDFLYGNAAHYLPEFFRLFNRAYQVTTNRDGRIFTEVPGFLTTTHEYQQFEKKLKATEGISISKAIAETPWGRPVMKLVRGDKSPDNLRSLVHRN